MLRATMMFLSVARCPTHLALTNMMQRRIWIGLITCSTLLLSDVRPILVEEVLEPENGASESLTIETPSPSSSHAEKLGNGGEMEGDNSQSPKEVTDEPEQDVTTNEATPLKDEHQPDELFVGAFYVLDSSVGTDSNWDISQTTGDEFDDRTLLDIFGEVTKEFLTQRVVSLQYLSYLAVVSVESSYPRD